MTLQAPEIGDVFDVLVRKRLKTYPTREWVNTYQLTVVDTASQGDVTDAVDALVSFEQTFLIDSSEIYQSKVHLTGTKNEFIQRTHNLDGLRLRDTKESVPLELVLLLNKQPDVGRSGTAAYRNTLFESDIESSNGLVSLSDYAAMQSILDTANLEIEDYLSGGSMPIWIVKYSATSEIYQYVQSIGLKGAGTRNLGNRWFNRSAV